ncbi:MAG: hypothetical protein KDA42_08220 [Planctomycetales bacterium]|nr:hypothetical protein [Planctomycetales bacterium]
MSRWIRCISLLLTLLIAFPALLLAEEAVPADPPLRYWKGNIHTHSLWSDGDDFPEMIAEWYRTHGYNFLALSDHNVLSEGQRWMKHDSIVRRGGADVVDKYRARFGGGWVETRGEPGSKDHEVRLKPLNEFRALVEARGQFLMIQGEEISDRAAGKPVHMNATNIKEAIQPLSGETVRQAIENNFRAVEDQAQRTGRPILLHLNHPNFGLAITAEDLAAVVSERFFEVYNGHPGVKHLGDDHHPGVERLWDIANTLRLDQLDAAPLFGVATDDSHNYHRTSGATTGRGWIMVRSRYLTPEHLIRAIKAGDFYASSGVTLATVAFDTESKTLRLEIEPEADAQYTIEFIGTKREHDRTAEPRDGASHKYSDEVGQVLAKAGGTRAEYRLAGDELYVRAVVTSSLPHSNPSFADQPQQAWTQPVGWEVTK